MPNAVKKPMIVTDGHPDMPAAEWQTRVDLAAMYRLAALSGWDDMLATHMSARVAGEGHQFLINPAGLMFDEITASSLVKVDQDGNILDGSPHGINRAGYVIHSAVHMSRPDAKFIVHLHTIDGMAVATQTDGLLPLTQTSLVAMPQLAYHDYEGIALDLDERERLVADLGDKTMLMLRNHGTLALGATAGHAWFNIYTLERSCALQIRALSAGRSGIQLAPATVIEKVTDQIKKGSAAAYYEAVWAALLRRVARLSPGFDS